MFLIYKVYIDFITKKSLVKINLVVTRTSLLIKLS